MEPFGLFGKYQMLQMPYRILLLEALVVPCQLIQDSPLCGKLPLAAKHKSRYHDLKLEPRHIHLRMNVFQLRADVLNSHIHMFLLQCFLAVCEKSIRFTQPNYR